MKRFALLFALGGCDAIFGLDTPKLHDGGGSGSGSGSGSGDCTSMVGEYGKSGSAGWFQYCAVTGDVMFTGTTSINTDEIDGRCAAHETIACLIEGGTITVNGLVTVTGSRPLILAASTEIDITGSLDVSSSPSGDGPGVNPSDCSPTVPGSAGLGGVGGGGGAGGTWSSKGGAGGRGGDAGAAGGAAMTPTDPPTTLRGGCSGGAGGPAIGGGAGGIGGTGGGALYLTSPQIVLGPASRIASVGMFGTGGASGGLTNGSGGGAGGGTGGLIVFDTATLRLPSTGSAIYANGGGGGAGGDPGAGGASGMQSTGPLMAGNGGFGGASGGGIGGTGGMSATTAGKGGDESMSTHSAGGGGGGGQGFILLFSMNSGPDPTDVRFSPPFIIE